MSIPFVLSTGCQCLDEVITTVPRGGRYAGSRPEGEAVYIVIYNEVFLIFSCKGETHLRPKMSKARQQEDQEAEKGLDRLAFHLIV